MWGEENSVLLVTYVENYESSHIVIFDSYSLYFNIGSSIVHVSVFISCFSLEEAGNTLFQIGSNYMTFVSFLLLTRYGSYRSSQLLGDSTNPMAV